MVDFDVSPGIISTLIYVFLEVIAITLADYAVTYFAANQSYRLIASGRMVLLREANILGVTRHLIGGLWQWHNVLAACFKLCFMSAIFYINFSVSSTTRVRSDPPVRMSSFYLNPSDAAWQRPVVYTVERIFDAPLTCYEQTGDRLTYYRLAFNLSNGLQLDSELGTPGVDKPGSIGINRSTLLCMRPGTVANPQPLASVLGCTRRDSQGCGQIISVQKRLNASIFFGKRFAKSFTFRYVVIPPEEEDRLFPEFPDSAKRRFTCLGTYIGAELKERTLRISCLLVYRTGTQTIVEEWVIVGKERLSLVLKKGGPVFEGDLPFERQHSAQYVSQLGSIAPADWRTLSGSMISIANDFEPVVFVKFPRSSTVSTMPLIALVLAGCTFGLAVVFAVIARLYLRPRKTPMFNSYGGIASLVRLLYSGLVDGDNTIVVESRPKVRFEFSRDKDETYLLRS